MSSKLIYRDVAVGADEDAVITATGASAASDTTLLPDGAGTPALITLEQNLWVLDGGYTLYDAQPVAFLSSALSGADGAFESPPALRIDFGQQYTSLGVSLIFSQATPDFCAEVEITWYQGATQIAQQTFYPDAPAYFCAKTVEAYNRIDITLKKTSLPYRRARLDPDLYRAGAWQHQAQAGSTSDIGRAARKLSGLDTVQHSRRRLCVSAQAAG